MNILAFDTATDVLTIAIQANGELRHEQEFKPRAHLKFLLPKIDALIKTTKIKKEDLDYLAVGIGPGSFTGLRIGLATAHALAHGLNKPLVGVPTIDIIAEKIGRAKKYLRFKYFCLVLDAKKGELYTTILKRENLELKTITNLQLLKPDILTNQLKNLPEAVLVVGDGILKYKDFFKQKLNKQISFANEEDWYPDAAVLINLAKVKIKLKVIKPYYQVLPIYVRPAQT